MSAEKITIFDTTLRDGEQSPGCSMNTAEKLEVARALVDLGVDVIEAGFPIASPGDFEAVREIARQFGDRTVICAWPAAWKKTSTAPGRHSKEPRRRGSTSFWQPAPSTGNTSSRWPRRRSFARRSRWSSGPSTIVRMSNSRRKTRPAPSSIFCARLSNGPFRAGATTINIPDTVGYAVPEQYRHVFEYLRKNVPNIDRAVLSAHCHDDLGLGVANSLAAIDGGARQVECTINGLGERAGNAALEEIVMAIKTRSDYFHLRDGHPHASALSDQPSRLPHHRDESAAEQGHRRPERLRTRGRHPSARRAAGADDLRDHAIGGRRLCRNEPRPGKHSGRHAFRDRVRAWGPSWTTRRSKKSSTTSSSWPTRRRMSTMQISSP